MRLHRNRLQSAALEDAGVRLVMLLVSRIEPGRIDIERVGVLHDELPHAQQPGFRTRLIAKFRLDLIPDLRQLFIAAQLPSRYDGDDFLMRHAQAEIAIEAVLEAEHILPHHIPAARFLPDLRRMQRRQQHLLTADPVHLFAHNSDDLVQ